jgi:hypothetical protein
VLDELEATRHALSLAEPHERVVICADEITAVWKMIMYHSPRYTRSGSISVQPNLPH